VEDQWIEKAKLRLFADVLVDAFAAQEANKSKQDSFRSKIARASHSQAVAIAKEVGLKEIPYWNWDAPRTREGYYRYQGGTQCAINRAVAFAPYADLLWMETKSPIMAQAKEFAEGVHSVYPEQWLAYNLSPSFNWDAAGLGSKEMKDYVWELGKLGFVWQFITVRGVHVTWIGCRLCWLSLSTRQKLTCLINLFALARRSTLECIHLGSVRTELRKGGDEGLCGARPTPRT